VDIDRIAFQGTLSLFLRDRPRGTTVDLNEFTVAYWDGRRVAGAHLRHDGSGRLDEAFDFDERMCDQLQDDLVAWMGNPRYTVHPELDDWLNGERQSDASADRH
jgi:hypothetical protein